ALTQNFMKIVLGKRYEKFFAASATEARKILNEKPIKLIFMDLSLKGDTDGITLTKEIRKNADFRDIPIIALTAHAFARDRENALSAGCNEFFSKPFNRNELIAIADGLIAERLKQVA
ncbi:MAG: hypothetical protein CL946_04840, partial [Ectothiorhodospiraceae bacterium]|nr:hypothetical protein [Ectothiorhodospiraceae bacterium]